MEKGDKKFRQASRADPRPLIERLAESFDLPGGRQTRSSETGTGIPAPSRTDRPAPGKSPGPPPRRPRKTLPWMRARAKARAKP